MRGEYQLASSPRGRKLELPPRARRILLAVFHLHFKNGTTSACAENTIAKKAVQQLLRNYLRVRGEYFAELALGHTTRELPPRARRILAMVWCRSNGFGTTSACAENTHNFMKRGEKTRNYLRVRGEYPK